EVGAVDVRVGVVAEVLEGRVRGEVGGPDVDRVAGRIDLPAENRTERLETDSAGRADLQDRVDVRVVLEAAHLHGRRGVHEDHHILEVLRRQVEDLPLVGI